MLQTFLFGANIQKSISPAIHNALFAKLRLNAHYSLLDVNEEEFDSIIKSMPLSSNVLGFNITAPYKERIIRPLFSIDQRAKTIGAVNTVKVDPKGRMFGSNTDVDGIEASLRELGFSQSRCSAKKAMILGAGGAARACTFALLSNGFGSVSVLNRSHKRAKKLGEDFKYSRVLLKIFQLEESTFKRELQTCDLLINAISETSNQFPIIVDFSEAKKNLKVFDLGYKGVSPLLKNAQLAGLPSIDGLVMLVEQAAKSFETWTGLTASRRLVVATAKRAIRGTLNDSI
ncbi:MAG: shikimate dehydrogenase family protein [Nitrososphaerales archaeon]